MQLSLTRTSSPTTVQPGTSQLILGVIHQISNLLIPASVVFTPLKYIYGLHDYIFAETLAASDYAHLANDSTIHQTIFAPVDEAYADSFETDQLLKKVRYNFVEEQIELPSEEGEYLFETMYTLASLDGAGQRLKLSKRGEKYLLNNEAEILPKKGKYHQRFALKCINCGSELREYVYLRTCRKVISSWPAASHSSPRSFPLSLLPSSRCHEPRSEDHIR